MSRKNIALSGCGGAGRQWRPLRRSRKSTDRADRRDQRHLRYIKEYRQVLYTELLLSGRLFDYLADLNEEAEEMPSRLVKQLAEKEGVTEKLKAEDSMMCVRAMNNIRNRAEEVVYNDLIYN